MMTYLVTLHISKQTFQRFQHLHQQFNQGVAESLSKPLGETLADISCEIIHQVFGEVSKGSLQQDVESDKTIQQVSEIVRKYMPWSVSFFGNDRLLPMVNHLHTMMLQKADKSMMVYSVENVIMQETLGCLEHIKQGNHAYIAPAFKAFTQIVDQGITSLVRQPKDMLKFNIVVNKTLNGVIRFTTQLGYKRLEKLGAQLDAYTTEKYFQHLLGFVEESQRVS